MLDNFASQWNDALCFLPQMHSKVAKRPFDQIFDQNAYATWILNNYVCVCPRRIHNCFIATPLSWLGNKSIRMIKKKNFSKGSLLSVKMLLRDSANTELTLTGVCLGVKHKGFDSTFVLEHLTNGVHAIQKFPLYSPFILSVKTWSSRSDDRSELYSIDRKMT